ncbi:hypothetical protein HZA97_07760 [Candidatus Woesearchaeota archaeon]|nr:hypothetical protein [Candidatus Woesearchaeota archaeon]
MNVKKLLGIVSLAISLSGCPQKLGPTEYLEGRVVKELGSAPLLKVRSIFKDGGTNIGELSYGLKVETDQGVYSFAVYEDKKFRDIAGNIITPKSLLVLEEQIEEGDTVRFALGDVSVMNGDTTIYFQDDKTGNVPSSYVSVVKKKGE